jgi:carbonic anhydrase
LASARYQRCHRQLTVVHNRRSKDVVHANSPTIRSSPKTLQLSPLHAIAFAPPATYRDVRWSSRSVGRSVGCRPNRPIARRSVRTAERFVQDRLSSLDEDLAILKEHTAAKQEPFAAVLACADSRVPVELIFDQTIGHVFVSRVAGNVCTTEIIASLEYGAAVLGVPIIMVLGHDGCGAVKATIDGKPVPGQVSALYAPLRPAVERAGQDLTAAIKANAQIQADLLRTASPVIAALIKTGKMKVVAAYYDLASGKVTILDQ